MVCFRYLITGTVQGVFFRASAQRQAIALGLQGWVRNLLDGRVELLAYGESAVVKKMEKWLQNGPEYAKVSNIEVIVETPGSLTDLFEIRPTSSSSE